jgi:deoxyribonuclease V
LSGGGGLRPRLRHPFDLPFPEARALQERLRSRVSERDAACVAAPRRIAGADVSFDKHDTRLHAAVVVLDARQLEPVEVVTASVDVQFPYVPGYLSFREIPPLLAAFAKLRAVPDVIVCDGHGRAHPRRFGLACHLGVLLDRPTLGVAKSRLVGTHREPGPRRGAGTRLEHDGDVIGRVLRTREGVKPVYVSVGHRVSLASACRLTLALTPRFRLPEPTRHAHREVNRVRREAAARRQP